MNSEVIWDRQVVAVTLGDNYELFVGVVWINNVFIPGVIMIHATCTLLLLLRHLTPFKPSYHKVAADHILNNLCKYLFYIYFKT
jgi:hypothetical protein